MLRSVGAPPVAFLWGFHGGARPRNLGRPQVGPHFLYRYTITCQILQRRAVDSLKKSKFVDLLKTSLSLESRLSKRQVHVYAISELALCLPYCCMARPFSVTAPVCLSLAPPHVYVGPNVALPTFWELETPHWVARPSILQVRDVSDVS